MVKKSAFLCHNSLKKRTFAPVFFEYIFLLLNFSAELRPRTRLSEQIQYYIEAAHHSADFNHSSIGAVAGLAENMGRGLRFLYARMVSAFPTGFRDESNNN